MSVANYGLHKYTNGGGGGRMPNVAIDIKLNFEVVLLVDSTNID